VAKSRDAKTRVGDVFEIPIDDSRVGFGQIIARRMSSYLMVVFKTAHPRGVRPPVQDIVGDEPAFLAETLDAKIWNGDWPVVGNAVPNASRVPLPVYKVTIGSIDNWQVESYDGARHRPAKPWELDSLQPRTVVAAIRLQKALQAIHGAAPWSENYRLMEYEYMRRSSGIAV